MLLPVSKSRLFLVLFPNVGAILINYSYNEPNASTDDRSSYKEGATKKEDCWV
jgi:hypothetical protein